jgi:transcriptional regulator with XRE-family HTH domain
MSEVKIITGADVKAQRKAHNLTQEELGIMAGYPLNSAKQSIYQIERKTKSLLTHRLTEKRLTQKVAERLEQAFNSIL